MSKEQRHIYWDVPIRGRCPMCSEGYVIRMTNFRFNIETLSKEKIPPVYRCEICGFEFSVYPKSM